MELFFEEVHLAKMPFDGSDYFCRFTYLKIISFKHRVFILCFFYAYEALQKVQNILILRPCLLYSLR